MVQCVSYSLPVAYMHSDHVLRQAGGFYTVLFNLTLSLCLKFGSYGRILMYLFYLLIFLSPPSIDNILAMVTVWGLRGKLFLAVFFYENCAQ